jgi:hypothetical protein
MCFDKDQNKNMKITLQQPTTKINKPNRFTKNIEGKKPPTSMKPRHPKAFFTQASNWERTTYEEALIGPNATNWGK